MSANTDNTPLSLLSFPHAILHVDGDAFFTSVEQALNPELRGKPVITGAERGMVICASYEAKALGVKRPMLVNEAKKICPQLVCLPSDYDAYNLFSQRMLAILRRFTPEVEAYSIDEAFAGLTGLRSLHHMDYSRIAQKIKDTLQKELMLNVSVGLGPTKTIAKMASQEGKPDGFTVVHAYDLHHFLKAMPLERVAGFGHNTVALLNKKGIQTALEYVRRPEAWAKQILGKIGVELWHELRGTAAYPIQPKRAEPLSLSRSKTFTPASSEKEFVKAHLIRNTEIAVGKLKRHQLRAGYLSIMLRTQDFKIKNVEGSLERATSSLFEIVRAAEELFDKIFKAGVRYRSTGIVLGKLEGTETTQYSLFEDVPRIEKQNKVDEVLEKIHAAYGKRSVSLGSNLRLKEKIPEKKLSLPLWQIKI